MEKSSSSEPLGQFNQIDTKHPWEKETEGFTYKDSEHLIAKKKILDFFPLQINVMI